MSIFPITPRVHQVQTLILGAFDVSAQTALEYAAELVALAEGWGSPEKAAQLDWSYRIRKDLGEKLRWRSETDRAKFQSEEQERFRAYDALIRTKSRA